MIFRKEVQFLMQSFNCQHREQHISKRNYEITVVQKIHISRIYKYKDGPLNFFISFSSEIWLIPFRILNSYYKSQLEWWIFRIYFDYFPNYEKF